MNWLALLIFLKYQYARAFGIIKVILNNHRVWNACKQITDKDIVLGQFIISMSGYLYPTLLNEFANLVKDLAHDEYPNRIILENNRLLLPQNV